MEETSLAGQPDEPADSAAIVRFLFILRGYADTLVVPRPAVWQERFAELLDEALDHGRPELDGVARRLFVSRRTLQRRLAEQGTSWRAELESARRRRVMANGGATAGPGGLARRLGYANPRSARRALRRWDRQPS